MHLDKTNTLTLAHVLRVQYNVHVHTVFAGVQVIVTAAILAAYIQSVSYATNVTLFCSISRMVNSHTHIYRIAGNFRGYYIS